MQFFSFSVGFWWHARNVFRDFHVPVFKSIRVEATLMLSWIMDEFAELTSTPWGVLRMTSLVQWRLDAIYTWRILDLMWISWWRYSLIYLTPVIRYMYTLFITLDSALNNCQNVIGLINSLKYLSWYLTLLQYDNNYTEEFSVMPCLPACEYFVGYRTR